MVVRAGGAQGEEVLRIGPFFVSEADEGKELLIGWLVEITYLCSFWSCFMEYFYFEVAMGGMELGWWRMSALVGDRWGNN